VLPGSNGCSRTLTVSRLWRLPRSHPRFTISAGRACRQSQGLTEAQEDLLDHWSPQRVIDDSHAKRALLVAAQTWAEPLNEHVAPLDRLLPRIVTGQAS
jgi:hypothetical protein